MRTYQSALFAVMWYQVALSHSCAACFVLLDYGFTILLPLFLLLTKKNEQNKDVLD